MKKIVFASLLMFGVLVGVNTYNSTNNADVAPPYTPVPTIVADVAPPYISVPTSGTLVADVAPPYSKPTTTV